MTASLNAFALHAAVRLSVAKSIITRRGDRGASLVEMALLLGLIAVVCIVALSTFGGKTSSSFSSSASAL